LAVRSTGWHRVRPSHRAEQPSGRERLRGRVDFIYPELAPVTRTAQARIMLDNPDGTLRPGDWARLSIFGGPKEICADHPDRSDHPQRQEDRVVVQDDDQTFSVRRSTPAWNRAATPKSCTAWKKANAWSSPASS
jgi:multidrug efflux pump subunit AcrA (membrane-fusion protein)